MDPQVRRQLLQYYGMKANDDTGDDSAAQVTPTSDLTMDPQAADKTDYNAMAGATPDAQGQISPVRRQLANILKMRQQTQMMNDQTNLGQQYARNQRMDSDAQTSNLSGFLNALNKSSAQAGTLGGKASDTSAPEAQGQLYQQQAAQDEQANDKRDAAADKLSEGRLTQADKLTGTLESRAQQADAKQMQYDTMRQNLLQTLMQKREHDEWMGGQNESNREMKLLIAQLMAQAKQGQLGQQQERLDDKDIRGFETALSPMKGARSPLGRSLIAMQSAQGLRALVSQAVDPKTGQLDEAKLNTLITAPNAREIALGLTNLLNGVGSEAQYEHMDPTTIPSLFHSIVQRVTGNAQGAGKGSLVKSLMDTVEREEAVREAQWKNYAYQTAAGYSKTGLYKRRPDDVIDTMARHNFDPEDVRNYIENHTTLETPDEAGARIGRMQAARAGGRTFQGKPVLVVNGQLVDPVTGQPIQIPH